MILPPINSFIIVFNSAVCVIVLKYMFDLEQNP
jgi:hypothetical protein